MTSATGSGIPAQRPDSWRDLFSPCDPGGARAVVKLNVIRRRGQPFFLLPASPRLAAKSLALYPAQTVKARAAKWLLGLALRAGVKPRLEKVLLPVAADDPFAAFLAQTAGLAAGVPPSFAMLAGNPRVAGRRFVLLVFETGGEPAAVVKAGGDDAARQLVAREASFLQTVPPRTAGVPKLRGTFHSARAQAFATDFFAGRAPKPDETAPLAELFASWLAVSRLVTMKELGAWRRLADAPLCPTGAGTG